MIAAFYRFVLRRRIAVLGALLALTACMGYWASRVRVESRSTDLFPSNHPYVATFNKYSDRFGNANRLAIMLAALLVLPRRGVGPGICGRFRLSATRVRVW